MPEMVANTAKLVVDCAILMSSVNEYAESKRVQTSIPTSGINKEYKNFFGSTLLAFSIDFNKLETLLLPNPSIVLSSSAYLSKWKRSAYSFTQPRLINFCTVCSESPSILTPSFETKRTNFFNCFAGQFKLVQCNVLVELFSLSIISVSDLHTGHELGIVNVPIVSITLITFGIILLDFITSIFVPCPPILSLSHSDMLHRLALFTVVPSKLTGLKTATGEMVEAAHDHSIYSNSVVALSSFHLKA